MAAAYLVNRVGNNAAGRMVADNCRIMQPGVGKVAVELIDRCPSQMFVIGKGRGYFPELAGFNVQNVEAFCCRKCEVVGLRRVGKRI